MTSFKVKCKEAKGFCQQATDAQLPNIYRDERERAKNNKGTEGGRLAASFARSAKAELIRRNLWPV